MKKWLPGGCEVQNRELARYMLQCLGTINVAAHAEARQSVFVFAPLLPQFFTTGSNFLILVSLCFLTGNCIKRVSIGTYSDNSIHFSVISSIW